MMMRCQNRYSIFGGAKYFSDQYVEAQNIFHTFFLTQN